MNFDCLTEQDIENLIILSKQVKNPNTRWVEKPGHQQKNYNVVGGDYLFELYVRQSGMDTENFSCGLSVIKPDGQPLTLLRYNGSNHIHGDITFACHIHKATEKAINAGKKTESHADETDIYHTLDGALFCLVNDANINGLSKLKADEADLFK